MKREGRRSSPRGAARRRSDRHRAGARRSSARRPLLRQERTPAAAMVRWDGHVTVAEARDRLIPTIVPGGPTRARGNLRDCRGRRVRASARRGCLCRRAHPPAQRRGLDDQVYQRLLRERIISVPSSTMRSPTRCAHSCCCSRPRTPSATSTSTSTRPAARGQPAWRSTTPCSTSPTTWLSVGMGMAASMASSCWCQRNW